MSLQLPQPPAAALRAVLGALDDLDTLSDALPVRSSAVRRASGPLTPVHPLPVHLLDPAAGEAGPVPLALARRTGWRFLIRAGEGVVAAAETRELFVDGLGETQAFAHFTEGPYPASTLHALQQARLYAAGTPTTYLPRLLSVPGYYMTALWLHPVLSVMPSPDLLIPLVPAPLGVTPHVPHHAEELLSLLAMTSGALLTSPA